MTAAIDYVLGHLPDLLHRDVVLDLFTIPDRTPAKPIEAGQYEVESLAALFIGKLVEVENELYRVEEFEEKEKNKYICKLSPTNIRIPNDGPILTPQDECLLHAGVLPSYKEKEPLKTTIGRVYMNYLLFCDKLGDVVPYINDRLDNKVENILKDLILRGKIKNSQGKECVENINYIANSPEFVSPNLTLKSLTTNPEVGKRRKELLEQYKDKIKAGDSIAMSEVESQLIKMDKDWLKDDPSMRYFKINEKKMFNNVRKKLLLVHGSVKKFGQAGSFDFIPTSLEEGYQQKTLAETFNEIRDGTYSRSTETALGGEQSKTILRVFQNTRIVEKNCGSTDYLKVKVEPYNSKEYLYRNFNAGGNKLVEVTEQNYKSLEGKVVEFRSPLYCHAKGGYCDTCMGKVFENIGQKALATAALEIGSTILQLSMKAMHTSGVETVTLEDLDAYIVD